MQAELPKMPMLQTRWPYTWFQVKKEIESQRVPFISLSAYGLVCNRFSVSDGENQELLVDFLHDLGIVLHFKDIQLLDTHVLDPKWVTEGVYRIINSRLVADNKGILPLARLPQVLKKPSKQQFDYPAEKFGFLVDLMLKFEVCYQIGKDSILVPDLLDIQEPEIEFDGNDSLNFIFAYGYFPKSVMPRFIVRMHSDIKDNKRWRTGVLLKDPAFDAISLVRADEKAKRIYISVIGSQRRDYFSALRKVISDINASFERLTVTEFVPLPDYPEILIEYRELLGHEKAGRADMFVGRVESTYDVQKMLNGVELPTNRKVEHIINVGGDFYAGSNVNQSTVNSLQFKENTNMNHAPATWEKVIVYLTAVAFIGFIAFLIIRNQPIADPNLVVALRIVLSVVIAAFGAAIPGFLQVDFSGRGWAIRAAGALGLFVVAYWTTPQVLRGF